ncbi:hypothetical protein ACFFP0_06540 [Rhizobium puerariae]|uniref:Cucumopine synthase C-terminal helical bundle domain-containing protein n=1 Tax=Rhizobium puerariae TaxID=1585791 RepID=A0ABV6ACY7_9HYPH
MNQPQQDTIERFLQDISAETARIEREEPEDHRKLRTGMLDDRAGCYGQYFGTWDIAHGMLRDCSMYALYPMVRMARLPEMEKQLPRLIEELLVPYTNYLGYSGFPQFEEFGDRLRGLMAKASPAELERMLSAFLLYVNRLYCWAYHYFPWNLGEQFKYADAEAIDAALAADAVVKDGFTPTRTLIRMTWEPLGISVRAWLATDQNPELCDDLLKALPFRILQEHPMVTGESMFAWAPMTSTAPVRVKEEIRKAPLGRLRFSQRTGQKLIVQYGLTKETILAPVLGGVIEEDLHKLQEVGRAVWKATYETKELIWLTVEEL